MARSRPSLAALLLCLVLIMLAIPSESSHKAFRRDPGHPQWHHGAFQDVKDSVRSKVRRMLHTRAEVPFQVPLEVNVVLVGFSGDGGYRYSLDAHKLEESLRSGFPIHRPSCLETGEPIDIEHHIVYSVFPAGQAELISLEKAVKESMVPAGTAREPTDEEMKNQEGDYIYRYRYNGGGASQVWLGCGRFAVIDLSAGPCTYGKIEAEEGSIGSRTLPRLRNVLFPKGLTGPIDHSRRNIFVGQLGALISSTIEHVIAPDVRFETFDISRRVLVPIIVLQNHNRYNIMEKGHNYSIDVEALRAEVTKLVYPDQEVVIVGGTHPMHRHEKLAIAVSKAMRGHSVQETKKDGRFHIQTKTYLDGPILKEEMERSADVLAAGILEMTDPSLSNKFFLRQQWLEDPTDSGDSILKHKPLWSTYNYMNKKEKKKESRKKQGELYQTYGTRVIPVFILSLADVDPHLLMEDESLVWTSNDVVIVLEHQNENIPLSYVSETERRHAIPSQAQRHILAGIASVLGGLSAPYEKASHVHERPVLNWLWGSGCHPYGPFSNASRISQILQDVVLRNTIYGRVDSALHRIRDTSQAVQAFASEYLKTPLGEPVKGKKSKSTTELWVEKFYKKTTKLPEPFPHELVERLEKYLDSLEEQLVDLSSLLYDHRLEEAHLNSTQIFQTSIFTQHYVDNILYLEREKMRCCEIEYRFPSQRSQTFIYGGILVAGFVVYFLVVFFSDPVR